MQPSHNCPLEKQGGHGQRTMSPDGVLMPMAKDPNGSM